MRTDEITIPGLHASEASPLSFAPDTLVRAFRLERPDGDDVVVYAAPGNRADGATRQYLGHWHEAMVGEPAGDAQVIVHAGDAAESAEYLHVRATFDRAFALGEDFEAIPMPGHTPGSTAFVWRTGEHRVLFTADSLYPGPDGDWKVAVLDSSDPVAYADSLDRLAAVEFDVLAPWAAPAGHPGIVVVEPDEARRRLTAAAERIRNGETR